jgi:hypothetical protein
MGHERPSGTAFQFISYYLASWQALSSLLISDLGTSRDVSEAGEAGSDPSRAYLTFTKRPSSGSLIRKNKPYEIRRAPEPRIDT